MTEWEIVIAISTAITAIATMVTVHYLRKDHKTKFALFQRKKENGEWFIYLGAPSKPIRDCNVTFKGGKLLVRGKQKYEVSIPAGSGCNFDLPDDISDNDEGMVVIKEGKHKIEQKKFNKIEREGY